MSSERTEPNPSRSARIQELQQRAARIRQAQDEMLLPLCQFLALSNEDKLAFLPPISKGVTYMCNECGDRTDNPLYYYCNAIFELTDRYRGTPENGFADLITDISVLLGVMIEQKAHYPWIWYLDKKAVDISDPSDRLWNILRRLAEQALAARNWPREFPAIPFAETGYSGVRQPPTNPKQG